MLDRAVTILHITDLHLNGSDFSQSVVLGGFLADLDRLSDLGLKPDIIIVSGDLANAADDPFGHTAFIDAIDRVMKATGLDERNIILCPGNHDVSRRRRTG